jgi:hypothetical protein
LVLGEKIRKETNKLKEEEGKIGKVGDEAFS